MKKALITGINGQDGSYLAELLLEKGYEVWGILKRNSVAENQTARIPDAIFKKIKLEYADMTDMSSLVRVLQLCMPDEIYNLAAQSHVRISFDQPLYTTESVANGTLKLLEAMRLICPKSRFYQASSSEMFGNNIDEDGYQRETTAMSPVSPYGCAKVFAYNICRNYRNAYDLFISNGILFNHESPRRGTNFVTNKVVKEAVKIKLGLSDKLALGNLDASRDWGYAKDFVEGKVSTMEAQAEKMAQERAETHQSNADAVAEAEKAIGEKYDATKTEYTEDLNKLIAFITDNEDPARTDSIAEALADLQEADAAMDNSFLAFNDEQNKAQEELQTEYGSSLDVSIILFGELLGEKQQRVVE